jgi:hypothetical protein
MRKMIRSIWAAFFVILVTAGLIAATSNIQAFRKELPPELIRREALLVDPDLLKILSGEFQGLLADYLLLKAAIIDGGEPEKMTEEDWQAIYVLYKQSMVLDPLFYTTAYYTQGNLAWHQGMERNAVELLTKSAESRDWDWNPHWFLGFDYVHLLNDKAKAVEHLLSASYIEGAPLIFGILAARIEQGEGQTQNSIAMLEKMYHQTDNETIKEKIKQRIQAHIGVYQIEQAISAFASQYNRYPYSLEELSASGILAEMPDHPYDDKYYYDPQTGHVDYGQKKH